MDRYRTPVHWVGWGSIALLALACIAPWLAATQFGLVRGGEFVLAFAAAAAVGLLIGKRALTTMGGAGALALIVAVAVGGAEAGLTWGVAVAGLGALGLVAMPWRIRDHWR